LPEIAEESKQQYEVLILNKINPFVHFNILGGDKSSDILIGNALLLATNQRNPYN
jgi:hypothetical protein